MNGTVKIRGGNPLTGEVTPIPNKNSIVAALPASILAGGEMHFKDVPDTADVQKLIEILKLLGAKVDDSDYGLIKIDTGTIKTYKVDQDLGSQIRASILFAGPLLARFGVAEVPVPGGCVLGARSIAAHVDVFTKVGIKVEYLDNYVRFTAPSKNQLKENYIVWQNEASVTATENFAMYAAGVDANFELVDAACEPHVTQIIQLLSDMGANIEGIGTNWLRINGSEKLKPAKFVLEPDFVDIAGYIVAAAVTKGKIRIKNSADFHIIGGLIEWFRKFNIEINIDGNDLIVSSNGDLRIDCDNSGFPLAAENMPKLSPRPWPGFPVDVLPVMATLASKTHGQLLLSNWMYESGLDFVRELNAIGANIFILSPQRVIINGPVNFKGGEVLSPGIIQACKAIFLASLCDDVETTIHGVNILQRRYPNIFDIYKSIGADITQ